MKLTAEDKNTLKRWGCSAKDFKQIDMAIRKTEFTVDGERITLSEVSEILGRETFLSGIVRSSFHWTCVRENEHGVKVFFDSSALFR